MPDRKRIMICFDGTNNHPRDARQEREWFGLGDFEDNGITNILKLHVFFGGDLENEREGVPGQHSFYYSGVGTYGNGIQRIFNAGFAPANLDVRRIIKNAGADLKEVYRRPKGDFEGDEIYIFGFSRGAAIARRFASVIHDYIDFPKKHQPVRFLGVFDTVASIGVPNLDDDEKPKSDVVFENHTISPHVQEALHLVSLDERRNAFMPTLMNHEERVTEIWMPGAHSDVGGGFWFDGLSDIALRVMLERLDRLGVPRLDVDTVDYARLVAVDGSYEIDPDDLYLLPNVKGAAHLQDRFAPIAAVTLDNRRVRVNVQDAPSKEHRPLVHESVGKRIGAVAAYRPKSLKGVRHDTVADDGSPVRPGLLGVQPYIEGLNVMG